MRYKTVIEFASLIPGVQDNNVQDIVNTIYCLWYYLTCKIRPKDILMLLSVIGVYDLIIGYYLSTQGR